ncbi:MAG TPA: ferritin-like domain-containing protein [Ktedonobacteraceae bacterium]|jgi:hypothetical protein|nr:ferritin-like domain-containing protein [Ktedonobacteraceae bacterium]
MTTLDKQMDEIKNKGLSRSTARRSFLKGAVTGAVGSAGLAAGALTTLPAMMTHAASVSSKSCVTPIKDIFTIARTAERLAVTFYSHGVAHAAQLGLSGDALSAIRAALVEEQIHELFFASAGGDVLASTFSFPHGPATFTQLSLFIATQQQLEGVFDSAFLSAIREFAVQGRPDLAQIAGQIATIEAEHRALGRYIGDLDAADNWAFSPVLVGKVGEAPALVAKAGYLSPKGDNSFTYHQVSTSDPEVTYRQPFAAACS